MPASSNGQDSRFSVYKSEFDSLCEYQEVQGRTPDLCEIPDVRSRRILFPRLVALQTPTMVYSYNGYYIRLSAERQGFNSLIDRQLYALLAQLVEALVLGTSQCRFESCVGHQLSRCSSVWQSVRSGPGRPWVQIPPPRPMGLLRFRRV